MDGDGMGHEIDAGPETTGDGPSAQCGARRGATSGSADGSTGPHDQVGILGRLVEGWSAPTDGDELVEVLGLVDRLLARCHRVVGELDASNRWACDGATSMAAWLQERARLTAAQANAMARTARRLRRWPATAAAWETGALSSGQVQAISANVAAPAVGLFAEGEEALVPTLVGLSVRHTSVVMQRWAARAEATLADRGRGPGDGQGRSRLHLSKVLDGRRRLDGDLSAEHGELLAQAMRVAESPDVGGEPRRCASERRADAVADICRLFLDHRGFASPAAAPGRAGAAGRAGVGGVGSRGGGRVRPHLNVLCDLGDLGARRGGHARLIDGTPLDRTTTQRLLCDAGIHRVITEGRSAVLDHGATTCTVPNALFQALVVRDRGCRFPGCDRPPEWTEAHHVVPWTRGGPTDIGNLVLMCTRHHHLVHGQHGHRAGWRLALRPDATVEVISPEGEARRSRPPP